MIMVAVDSWEYILLEAYCLGKPFWWQMFFGWRQTIDKGINGEWAFYKIPNKDDLNYIYRKAEQMSNTIGFDGL